MSKEALEQFGKFVSEQGLESFQAQINAVVAQGHSMEEACVAYARENGFDVTEDEVRSINQEFPQELTDEQLDEATGGYMAPSTKPIVDAIASLICNHDWYFTGKEKEEPFFFFWSKHKKLYKCRKCGEREWRHED